MAKFGKEFLLGTATAAHQVEGDNRYSDYWAIEQMNHTDFKEPSGIACDHYHHYAEDIRLMAKAGFNAYRFSVEWARVEPEEGVFCDAALSHYQDMVDCCLRFGIEPIVTLHHFSSPAWLIRKGGWESSSTPLAFAKYAEQVTSALSGKVRWICTINEANMGMQIASLVKRYRKQFEMHTESVQVGLSKNGQGVLDAGAKEKSEIFGTPSPQTFLLPRTDAGDQIILQAHQAARDAIKRKNADIKVGLTLSLHDVQSAADAEGMAADEWEMEFGHYLPIICQDDFLGVQNYTRTIAGPDGPLPPPDGAKLTQMGYEYYPEALEHVLRRVAKDYPGDLLVTENGIATDDDLQRQAFIQTATDGVQRCIQDGLPVKGYLYWSFLDNFEWQKGYSMQFGLVAVNRKTMQRIPKSSLEMLGKMRLS